LQSASSEGAASFYEQTTTYGYAYWLFNVLLVLSLILASAMAISAGSHVIAISLLVIMALSAAIVGRCL
jgi:hypothetical protein